MALKRADDGANIVMKHSSINATPLDHSRIPEPWYEPKPPARSKTITFVKATIEFMLIAFVIVALSFVIILLALRVGAAFAHEAPSGWQYDAACCSGMDCMQAPKEDVKETSEGYRLSTGEVIAYSDHRVRRSHDEFFHECKPGGDMSSKHSFCLYVPDRGF